MAGKLTDEKAPGIEVYFLEVTPEVAAEMLSRNTKNQRTISAMAVERYASDMTTQEWLINGETIKFSDKNELIDGQHRLEAIKASGESQVLIIVWGLDAEAMATIDTGRKRSYADQLKRREIANHTTVASINNRLWHWFHGNYGIRGVGRIANPQHLNSTPSNAQKDYWMAKIEQAYGITIEAAAAFGHKASSRRPGISPSTYGFAWVILSGIDLDRRSQGEESDLRELFFHELLVESASPKLGYPIQALHNRLNRIKGDSFDNVDQLDAIFTVFNKWVKGQSMETVRPPRPVRWNILETPEGYKELSA